MPLAQPEGRRSLRWCHVTAAVSGSECQRGLLLAAGWEELPGQERQFLPQMPPGHLDLGTHHLLSIPGGLRWWSCTWPQCQKGVLPPGGHLSCEAHSSSSAWERYSSVPRDAATPALPDHLFCDRSWLSSDTRGILVVLSTCIVEFQRDRVVWRHQGGTWIALYTNVQ